MQLVLFVGILALITKPLGRYLTQVLDGAGRTCLDPLLKPIERLTYAGMGVNPEREQSWWDYTVSLLLFGLVGTVMTYFLLRYQQVLPMNPRHLPGLPESLAFNVAVSFATNTNWQSYAGESAMSNFSQMVALTIHHFTSAASGIGIAAALVRSLARCSAKTVGNFWVDVVRVTYYLLLPLSLVLALFMVSQGVVQNFKTEVIAQCLEPQTVMVDEKPVVVMEQAIVQGPMASQMAIKMLGTNGGGFVNANAAHPYENPTPLSNFVQMLAIFAIGSALTYHLGQATKNQAHGWSVWGAMMLLFIAGVLACANAEAHGNPTHQALGMAIGDGNMEGKEQRFGVFASSLFTVVTTAASCGAVNTMHDSLTALGGMVPLFMMQLGEVVIGGVGSGLYGMLCFVVLAVFIAGLMVGRTPEYLGKKILAFEVKMAMLSQLIVCATVLGFTAWAASSAWGRAGLGNAGPHGFSEMLYAFSSAAGNNGSAFAGLTATPANQDAHYNVTLGLAMLMGRYLMIVPVMAMAGSLASKRQLPTSAGTFPVSGLTFALLLCVTVLLLGALNFLPALALGPLVEHFLNGQGVMF